MTHCCSYSGFRQVLNVLRIQNAPLWAIAYSYMDILLTNRLLWAVVCEASTVGDSLREDRVRIRGRIYVVEESGAGASCVFTHRPPNSLRQSRLESKYWSDWSCLSCWERKCTLHRMTHCCSYSGFRQVLNVLRIQNAPLWAIAYSYRDILLTNRLLWAVVCEASMITWTMQTGTWTEPRAHQSGAMIPACIPSINH
jgi:hypothetical protein